MLTVLHHIRIAVPAFVEHPQQHRRSRPIYARKSHDSDMIDFFKKDAGRFTREFKLIWLYF